MAFETRLTRDMVDRYTKGGFWGTDTIYGMLERNAAAHPDREALYDGQHRWSYGDLLAAVNRVAGALTGLPFGRAGYPEEVANVVAFMASDRASYVSGTVVTVDGGTVLRDSIY